MAPGELEDYPEPGYHLALDELTEQPGPRNTWSWPPRCGRPNGWM